MRMGAWVDVWVEVSVARGTHKHYCVFISHLSPLDGAIVMSLLQLWSWSRSFLLRVLCRTLHRTRILVLALASTLGDIVADDDDGDDSIFVACCCWVC